MNELIIEGKEAAFLDAFDVLAAGALSSDVDVFENCLESA